MTVGIDILTEDRRWAALDVDALAERAVGAALDRLLPNLSAEVSLLACNDARIAVLNADFRGKPQPTNVLSWPAEDRAAEIDGHAPLMPKAPPGAPVELGDIAIAFDTCAAEAAAQGIAFADHTAHLIVHGVLHLLGFDHVRDGDAALMERLESEILCTLGIADPYAPQDGARQP